MARAFDGTDDKITVANGDTDFVFGPGTVAFVLRKNNNNSQRPFMHGSAGATRLGMRFNSTSDLSLQCGATLQIGAVTVTAADGWALAAITKGSGSVNPRYHKYIFSSNAHTHADGAAAVADNTAPTADPVIGANNTNEFFNGDIAIGALWDVALTDAQIESLPFSLAAWFAPGQPRALWLLDQADVGQTLDDMTGRGANQNAITGTAVATESVPIFNYGIGPALERITAGGQTFFITPSGLSTPTGSLTKQAQKTLSGAATPTGALSKLVGKVLSAASTPTGALSKLISKVLSAASTPTGALSKLISKVLSAASTPTGVLALAKVVLLSLSGSSTPTGTLTKQVNKGLAGSSTPIGSLAKLVSKFFSGFVTPIGSFLAQLLAPAEEITITMTVGRMTVATMGARQMTLATFASGPAMLATMGAQGITQATLADRSVTTATLHVERG